MKLDVSVPYCSNQIMTIEWAIHYLSFLVHLLTDHLPTSSTLPPPYDLMIQEALARAEIVLWDTALQRCACDQATTFVGSILPSDLIPLPQLWIFTGNQAFDFDSREAYVHSAELIFADAGYIYSVGFGHALQTDLSTGITSVAVRVDAPIPMDKPASEDAALILSCIAFMTSTVASAEELKLPRPVRRRCLHKRIQPATIRTVQLRRRERQPNDAEQSAGREYNWQWLVNAHARRPNLRMKEQRPVWVNAYVKGPADKPLKPQATKVALVQR